MSDDERGHFDSERLSPADMEILMHRRAARAGRCGEISSIGDTTPAAIWSCRACKKPAPVTQAAIDTFVIFNAQLRSGGEAPMTTADIAFCESCELLRRAALVKRSQTAADKTTAMIRILRDGGTKDEERAAIEYIDKRFPGGEGREIVAAHVAKRNKNNQPMRGV